MIVVVDTLGLAITPIACSAVADRFAPQAVRVKAPIFELFTHVLLWKISR